MFRGGDGGNAENERVSKGEFFFGNILHSVLLCTLLWVVFVLEKTPFVFWLIMSGVLRVTKFLSSLVTSARCVLVVVKKCCVHGACAFMSHM